MSQRMRISVVIALFYSLPACSDQPGSSARTPAADAEAPSASTARPASSSPAAERTVQGLWAYERLGREGAPFTELRGYFIFKNGWFVQQSLNVGEPFDRQIAQGHAGPYRVEGDRLHMTARVGLIANPAGTPPLRSRHDSEHVVKPVRDGDRMALQFGSGTIQQLILVGPGEGRIYPLERGALALIDGRFILVAESPEVTAAGSGRFKRNGDTLRLDAERWFVARDGTVTYKRGPMEVAFDERRLTLSDGSVFMVTAPR